MRINSQFEGLGFSQALFSEGYISLAEETVGSGKRVGVPGGHDAYYVYQITPELAVWAYQSGEELHFLSPFYMAGKPVRAAVENYIPFAGCEGRYAAETVIGAAGPESAGVKIYFDMLNARLYMDAAGRPRAAAMRRIALAAYLEEGSFSIYSSEKEYEARYDGRPSISGSAIVPLRSVDRDETQAEDLPYAHITGPVSAAHKSVNDYTREIFYRLDISAAGIFVPVFAGGSATGSDGEKIVRAIEEKIHKGHNPVFEGDVYFASRIL